MRARALITAVAAAAGLVLAGCGADTGMPGGMQHSPPPSSSPGPTQHNQADVSFAQGMIPHHAQAVMMARLANERGQSEQVKNLARRIEAAQGPEIETMNGWLREWGVAQQGAGMPGTDHGNMPGMGHGNVDGDMHQLMQASGPEFDRLFLTSMIKHHEGAITMSQAELANGQAPPAKALAQQIIGAQQAEIGTMQQMLQQG